MIRMMRMAAGMDESIEVTEVKGHQTEPPNHREEVENQERQGEVNMGAKDQIPRAAMEKEIIMEIITETERVKHGQEIDSPSLNSILTGTITLSRIA